LKWLSENGLSLETCGRLSGAPEEDDPADKVPPAGGAAVSRHGDVWVLGQHRLLCGDALSQESYDDLLAGQRARMAKTSWWP
jgi:hypothetical protein